GGNRGGGPGARRARAGRGPGGQHGRGRAERPHGVRGLAEQPVRDLRRPRALMAGGPARRPLTPLPTPLEPAPRFSEAAGVEVWVKRDDIGSIGLAGNKGRKLEYPVAAPLAGGTDTPVTPGAAASHPPRATAAAAAQAGLRCVLVLGGEPPDAPNGNVLLDGLFGAELRFARTGDWSELDRALHATAAELRSAGSHPYVMPAGCSSPLGAVGFVHAHTELAAQMAEAGIAAQALYHASSSRGTHAGPVAGP